MERLLKFKFSTATLGEKKANVKREVVFVLLSPRSLSISRSVPEAICRKFLEPSTVQGDLQSHEIRWRCFLKPGGNLNGLLILR
jgi:hypothetical protein